jgi:hypothetical protein
MQFACKNAVINISWTPLWHGAIVPYGGVGL